MAKITPQNYPRIDDVDNHYNGCLDEAALVPHEYKISEGRLKELISSAIINANKKSSRQILSIPPDASESEVFQIYKKEGQKLFSYFKKYVGDPAATAHQLHGKHYTLVSANWTG